MASKQKLSTVSQETLGGKVYASLKLALLNGDFVPGKSVTIRGLAAELDVSSMPVREALRRLVAERALHLSSTGRVNVPLMTPAKLAGLVNARICLEKQAAMDAIPQVNDLLIRRLIKLNAEVDANIAVGNHRDYLASHREFHFSLYRVCSQQVFMPLIESVWLQISPFLRFTLSLEHLSRYTVDDRHVEMIDALKKRDATALGFALEADIRQGIGSLTEADWAVISGEAIN